MLRAERRLRSATSRGTDAARRVAGALGRARTSDHAGRFGGHRRFGIDGRHDCRSRNDRRRAFRSTYVPARNTMFLSLALAWAEVVGARDIFVGVNAVDYSGYPDCRPAFIAAFEQLARFATKAGVEGARFKIHAPLIDMSQGRHHPHRDLTWAWISARRSRAIRPTPDGRACGKCDSCRLRAAGFSAANLPDPTRYR